MRGFCGVRWVCGLALGLVWLLGAGVGIASAAEGASVVELRERFSMLGVAEDRAQADADRVAGSGVGVSVTESAGGSLVSVTEGADRGKVRGRFGRAPMASRVVAGSAAGEWTRIELADGQVVRFRVVGRQAASGVDVAGSTVVQSGAVLTHLGALELVSVVSSQWVEEFVTVPAASVQAGGFSLVYEFDLSGGLGLDGDARGVVVTDADGAPLVGVPTPLVQDELGVTMPAMVSIDGPFMTVTPPTWGLSAQGDVLIDPQFESLGSGEWYGRWCNDDVGQACDTADTAMPESFSHLNNLSYYLANGDSPNISGQHGVYLSTDTASIPHSRATYLRYQAPSGNYVTYVSGASATAKSANGWFGCRVETGRRASVTNTNFVTTEVAGTGAGTDFMNTITDTTSGQGKSTWVQIRMRSRSGSTQSVTNNGHYCSLASTSDRLYVKMTDNDGVTEPVAPDEAAAADPGPADEIELIEDDAGARWYGPNDVVSVPYEAHDGDGMDDSNEYFTITGTDNSDGTVDGSGIDEVFLRVRDGSGTTGTQVNRANEVHHGASSSEVCTAPASGTRPCELDNDGYLPLTLDSSTVPGEGVNRIYVGATDFTAQGLYGSDYSTFRYDSTAPSTPSTANILNDRVDGVAVLSWTASTDSSSGIDHYEVRIWPDGQDSSHAYWQDTGSSAPYFNARLGVNPATAGWKWYYQVRAVDAAGNTGTASTAKTLGTTADPAVDYVQGLNSDQSTIGEGPAIVGLATGNVSVQVADHTVKAYGGELTGAGVYNHQDTERYPLITDADGTYDTKTFGAMWAMGWHTTASWERRLIRGDDDAAESSTYVGHGGDETNDPIRTLTYVDESGTRWPFTPTDTGALTFATPVGMYGATLTRDHNSTTSDITDDTYTLAYQGGSTLNFDADGRLTSEDLANGRSITYTREGSGRERVTAIKSDDPDGAGSGAAFELTIAYDDSGTYSNKKVSSITDEEGRQTRFEYITATDDATQHGCSDSYLAAVGRYADSSATTALFYTEYTWEAIGGGSCNGYRISDIDTWVYDDDPATTGGGADPLKDEYHLDYTTNSQLDTITRTGTTARDVGTASPTKESIPAVADTLTNVDYVPLTSGGSAGEQLAVTVERAASGFVASAPYALGDCIDTGGTGEFVVSVAGTSSGTEPSWGGGGPYTSGTVTFVSGACPEWEYKVDWLGRNRTVTEPLEYGATTPRTMTYTYESDGQLDQTTSDWGDNTDNTYDLNGFLTQVEIDPIETGLPDQIQQFDEFDSEGRPGEETTVRAPDGEFLGDWAYALNDCVDAGTGDTYVVTIAGTSGSMAPAWSTAPDPDDTVTSGTSPNEVTFKNATCTPTVQTQTTLIEYDADGNVFQETAPDGVRTCSWYEPSGELDITYQLDGVDCDSDDDGDYTDETGSAIAGTIENNTYDSATGWLTSTEIGGATTEYTTNSVGEQTQVKQLNDTGTTDDMVTTTTYDGAGRATRTSITDASATRYTSTSYNMLGAPIVVTEPNSTYPTGLNSGTPAGDQTVTRYNERGLEYVQFRADSTIVTKRHDARGRTTYHSVPHDQDDASPEATTITYFHSGNKKSKTDPAGITTDYDPSITDEPGGERPVKITSPVSGTTTFTYTPDGELASKVTPAGTFSYAYDGMGNQTKVTYPSGDVLELAYDDQGSLTGRTYTPSGSSSTTTSTSYTPDGQVNVENQASGIDTDYDYDTQGRISKTVLDDDNSSWSQETRFTYDTGGRLDTQTLENGATDIDTTYDYENESGRLSKIERPDGHDERYVYDEQGRVEELKTVKRSDSSWQAGDTYAYDAQDRITTTSRKISGTTYDTSYTYDPAGQLTSETSEHGIVRSYTYGNVDDDSGFGTDLLRQTLHIQTGPGGSLSAARVDEIEQCATTTTCSATDSTAVLAALDLFTEPAPLTDPAASTSSEADVADWLAMRSNITWQASTAYPVGTCIDPDSWGGSANTYKITTAGTSGTTEPTWPSSGTVNDGTITWTKTACTPILILRQYTYDSDHQQTQMTAQDGTQTCFTYDTRGNQTYRGSCPAGTANQTWDELNRPTQLFDDNGDTVTLTWHTDQYRLKTYKIGTGPIHTITYREDNRIARIAKSGGWSINLHYDQSGLASFDDGTDHYYYDRSQRGDILGIRSSAGTVEATLRYAAYGEIAADTGALGEMATIITYNGRDGVLSVGAGLAWMQHRWYRGIAGSFMSADPGSQSNGSTQSVYNYANGTPTTLIDPSGDVSRSWRGCHFSIYVWGGRSPNFLLPPRKWKEWEDHTYFINGRMWPRCWGGAIPTYSFFCMYAPQHLRGRGFRGMGCARTYGLRPANIRLEMYDYARDAARYIATAPDTAPMFNLWDMLGWQGVSYRACGAAIGVYPPGVGARCGVGVRFIRAYPGNWRRLIPRYS